VFPPLKVVLQSDQTETQGTLVPEGGGPVYLSHCPPDVAAGDQWSEADIGIALCQLEVTAGDHGVRSGLCPGAPQLGVRMPRPCGGVTRLTACAPCHGRLLAHDGERVAHPGVRGDMEDALLASQPL
jgi:hypothetical protein